MNFKDLSLNISEKEYRELDALSYSLLSKYNKTGFAGLDKLYEKEESSSLTFGSLVDTLLTDKEHFDDKFVVVDLPKVSDKINEIVNDILDSEKDETIEDSVIIEYLNKHEYQPNWKDDTRLSKFKSLANEYFVVLKEAKGKTIISTDDYQQAVSCINKVIEQFPMLTEDPFEDVDIYCQLKFKVNLHGVDYKCMTDIVKVNHTDKTILITDFKTSGYPEYEFYKAYIKWDYQLQSRLYTRIVKEVISKSEQFKDYKVLPFRFIVVNKDTQTPLEWVCKHCFAVGELKMGQYCDVVLKDPETLGMELHDYLTNKPKVPNDVKINEANDLNWFINNKM